MRRRVFLFTLLVLLLLVGIPTGLLVREYRHEQVGRDLISAIKNGDSRNALAALKAGADPNTRELLPWEELPDTSAPSFQERLQQLLENMLHPHAAPKDNVCLTALLLCLNTNHQDDPALVKALLDAGANPNLMGDTNVSSPVMWAAIRGDPQSLRLLLQHGGNPQLKDETGETALHWAAVNDCVETLTLLLDAGADINALDNGGQTPLCYACEYNNNIHSIQLLMEHHANPNLRCGSGVTPLDIALSRDNAQISQMLRNAGAKTGAELDAQSANRTGEGKGRE